MRTSNFVSVTIPMVILGIGLLASPALGQSENEVLRKKIEVLSKEAERLQDAGASDKAEQLAKQALLLRAQLSKANENPRRNKSGGEQEKILNGLKAGAASLRALGRIEDAERLERLAAEIQKKAEIAGKRSQGHGNEREVALGQIKIMRMAMQGLLDAGREDSAAMIEHTIHAQELALEGVRNEKAAKVRETAPTLGQRVELMSFAARILREAGKKEQASAVGNLAEQLMVRFRGQQKRGQGGEKGERERKRRGEGGGKEREFAAAQIEVMQIALAALREGGRKDSAELLNRAIQARLVRLKSLKGQEAKIVLEREPKREQTIEALGLASRLWREFGNQKNTAAVGNLAEKLAAGRTEKKLPQKKLPPKKQLKKEQPQKERTEKQRAENGEQVKRLNQIKQEVAKLKAALEKRLGDLKELEKKIDR